LLAALIELVRGSFHALRFEHDGLSRGFECGGRCAKLGVLFSIMD
jgi:hypothetical protein